MRSGWQTPCVSQRGFCSVVVRARTVAGVGEDVALNHHTGGRGRRRCTGGVMFIGIDVAKAELVVGVRPTGTGWTAVNADQGVRDLVTRIEALAEF